MVAPFMSYDARFSCTVPVTICCVYCKSQRACPFVEDLVSNMILRIIKPLGSQANANSVLLHEADNVFEKGA